MGIGKKILEFPLIKEYDFQIVHKNSHSAFNSTIGMA